MKSKDFSTARRDAIRALGTVSTGALIMPAWAFNPTNGIASNRQKSGIPSLDKFGIQLYTLREEMPKDPKGILKSLSSFGFNQIEGYEGGQGMFWNMGHKDFKKYLDDLGMEMVSSHCSIFENFETKVEQAAEIGMSYLICPYIGPQKSMEDWKKVTELFNNCGRVCNEHGIRFAYHNHEYTFKAFSGMIPHDFLMKNTDPELVDHQMDIYWVVTGGADPIDYLERYPNRFRLCHVKDRMKTASPEERSASCDLGTGSIDYPKILRIAQEQGVQFFILEQERYDNSTPLKSAEVGAEYLKKLVFS